MGCGDKCPYIPGKRYIDWDLPDPKGQPARRCGQPARRSQRRVRTLLAELD